jgi:transcriptional regulator with XRE-family HTH domain
MRKRTSQSDRARDLRDLRIQKGYSRAQLSDRSGVAENVLYKIEAFGYVPTPRTIEKLAAVLGDDVRALFGEEIY